MCTLLVRGGGGGSCSKHYYQGVERRMVLVVNFLVFIKLSFFALLLLYVTWCTMWTLYMAYVSC